MQSVREYGKSMLGNRIKKGASDEELPIELSYKGQIIMGSRFNPSFGIRRKEIKLVVKKLLNYIHRL